MKWTRPTPILIGASLVSGVLLTLLMTVLAFNCESRTWACVFAWPGCLMQSVWHTPQNPAHEGSPIDLFSFILGTLLGMPVYCVLTYGLLGLGRRAGKRTKLADD